MTAPVIQTQRLTLRPYRMSDFPAMAAMYQTDRARFIGGPIAEIRVWYGFAQDVGMWDLMGFGGWAIDLHDGTLIGTVSLNRPVVYPETELGWGLHDGHEGQGYATEAATAARNWAFAHHGWDSIVSYIHPDNAASIRVAERLGATPDPQAAQPDVDHPALVFRHRRPGQ